MVPHDAYYEEFKWCPKCHREVHYLRSLSQSYCAQCGGEVRLFRSRRDVREFLAGRFESLPRGGEVSPPA